MGALAVKGLRTESLLISSVMLFTIEKIDVSSVKGFTFDVKLLGRSFMYIKNSNVPKIDPLLSKKLWRSVSKLSEIPLSSFYISNLHA